MCDRCESVNWCEGNEREDMTEFEFSLEFDGACNLFHMTSLSKLVAIFGWRSYCGNCTALTVSLA